MNAVLTLLWYETRRNAWVFYGAVVGLAVFTLFLFALPGAITGADMVGIPEEGEERDPRVQSRIEIESSNEEEDGSFSRSIFEWSFDSSRNAEEEAGEEDGALPSGTYDLPDELQFAFRPRQPAAIAGAMLLAAATLLGLFVAHMREADRGEMALHYQSPVPAEAQLAVRFLFASGAALGVILAALAIYLAIQSSQNLSASFPFAEGLGSTARIEWGNLVLASTLTQILPAAAFILLFVQIQNAYGLLGGGRLAGIVILLAGLSTSVFCYARFVLAAPEGAEALPIVAVTQLPVLGDVVSGFDLSRFRYEVPLEFLFVAALVTALMLAFAARIFREVEWS